MPAQLSAAELREHRRSRKATQKALAATLGVTPNTIARWERGEIPIPHWVGLLLALQGKLDTRMEEIRSLHAKVAELSELVKYTTGMRDLLDENARLRRALKRKDQELRDIGRLRAAPTASPVNVFRALARKYHPDLNPQHAEIMKDLAQLHQAHLAAAKPPIRAV